MAQSKGDSPRERSGKKAELLNEVYDVVQQEELNYEITEEANEDGNPTPHKQKLLELLENPKLPPEDLPRVQEALKRYEQWVSDMQQLASEGNDRVSDLVDLLNEYLLYIELNLIWDSQREFLYRQKGQLKIDNSVLEEFFPWLVDPRIIPELAGKMFVKGPRKAFSGVYFGATLTTPDLKLRVRTKDQDFTVSRPAYLKASYDKGFPKTATTTAKVYIAFVAVELKTNLDKTMFQEAVATAHDLKIAVPSSRYFVICQWLDMTPISLEGTDITEVMFLRGRRLASDERRENNDPDYRREHRQEYADFLREHPIRKDLIQRFVDHLRSLFVAKEIDVGKIYERGYF